MMLSVLYSQKKVICVFKFAYQSKLHVSIVLCSCFHWNVCFGWLFVRLVSIVVLSIWPSASLVSQHKFSFENHWPHSKRNLVLKLLFEENAEPLFLQNKIPPLNSCAHSMNYNCFNCVLVWKLAFAVCCCILCTQVCLNKYVLEYFSIFR